MPQLKTILCLSLALAAPTLLAAQRPVASRAVEARSLPRAVAYRGSVVAARQWADRLGENVLVITRTACLSPGGPSESGWCGDFETYAYHYVRRPAGWTLLWRTTDSVRECGEDVTLEPSPRTVSITDLDGDGLAETTFLYLLACRGGVDPSGMKLIMHEGATKYAIRGSTDMSREHGPSARGVMHVDPTFDRAPAAFRAFAVAQWNRWNREDRW
ncbi:MAG TPA: hypothetical protein VFJ82_25460 [Longimicrobium sp.]|nr:hypothetical protein [Longimicrobium sp.]